MTSQRRAKAKRREERLRIGATIAALLGLPSDLSFIITNLSLGGLTAVLGGYLLTFIEQLPTPLFWLLVASIFGLSVVGLNDGRLWYRKRRSSRQNQETSMSQTAVIEHLPEHPPPSIDARDRAQFHDEGSTWYGRLHRHIQLSDDAQASAKGSQFGKLQEGEADPEQQPVEEVN